MESPLNAREFLKRFHLPQLVRIHQVELEKSSEFNAHGQADRGTRHAIHKAELSPGHSNTSISSSFIAIGSNKSASNANLAADSEWNYAGGLKPMEHAANESLPAIGRSAQDHLDDGEDGQTYRAHHQGFRSLSAWSSVQVDRMLHQSHDPLSDDRCLVRVPRASLIQQPLRVSSDKQQSSVSARKSVEFFKPPSTLMDKGKRSLLSLQADQNDKIDPLHRMKLVPPSKSVTLNKLELNQPFLLYKAHKKIELCAYAIDQKNQLNEKSGDPIYFPHNYQGK